MERKPQLENLMAREHLIEDIESIVEEWWHETYETQYNSEMESLIRSLCDSVCKHFPATN
mgnify:CR=1|jgi:glutamyl-tRNA reductase